MKIRSVKYHFKQGVKSVFKNGLMSFASIASVAICSFILVASLCIVINLDSALEKIEESMGVSLYLGEELSDDDAGELLKALEEIPNILSIDYMSKEDALNWAKDEWGDEQAILSGLEEDNPFPRSFEISINGAKYQKQVIDDVKKIQKDFEKKIIEKLIEEKKLKQELDIETNLNTDIQNVELDISNINNEDYKFLGIEKIKHSQRQSDILLTTNNAIRIISIIIIFILAIISVAIIINTIKLTVYVRKNEINIMKYVGATDWFIRWPFFIEGIIIGLIGSTIPIIVCMSFYNKINELVYTNLPIVKNYIDFKTTLEMFLIIAPSTLLLGALLGIIGSVSSIKKHLNV